ncbi:hypothetical protein PV327_003325 [Microctonus hyperodae]|uniref:Alpha 1,4-glycosyltransferase domain-containing protein n=1 Tax=Microctonus hyperodae TaxID=165561 RepID=A0AA39G430_MICHY|nr:hypothetical protein PV327_003325 [Microctonus hyperodae]
MKKITRKNFMISILCITFIGTLFYIANFQTDSKQWISPSENFFNVNILVYMKPTTSYATPYVKEPVTEIIAGDKNIYFLETSHIKDKNEIILNPRQGCAVESAARMNPTMKVYFFLFNTNRVLNYSNETKNIIKQLMSYENIVIRHISLETYFENSPMSKWWNSTRGPNSSQWFTSHMSDVLRYLTLWKFSGIYLDLDVVILKSLEHLTNFVCAESSIDIAAGAIGFDSLDVGRQFANACLYEIMTNFRGDDWGYNGPGVITRTLKKICNTDIISEMTDDRCDGFKVFAPSAFYPIRWKEWKQYFNIKDKNATMKSIEDSLAIHVWNKHSQSTVIKVGSAVPYAEIANQYCPKVYNNCGDTF